MSFPQTDRGSHLSAPLEREKLYQVVLRDGSVVFVASAHIPSTAGTTRELNWLDPEFEPGASALEKTELKEIQRSMRQYRVFGWDDAFIDEACQHLVLGITALTVGAGLFGRWRTLLDPAKEFGFISMLNYMSAIRSIEEITPLDAHSMKQELTHA